VGYFLIPSGMGWGILMDRIRRRLRRGRIAAAAFGGG